MSKCTQIRLRELPEDGFLDCFKEEDGCVYLDIDINYQLLVDKVEERLTDVGEIQFNELFSVTLIDTPKMSAIRECYLDEGTEEQELQDIRVDIVEDGCINSDVELRIVSCKDGNIEADFILDRGHWANKMNKLTLCDLFDEDDIYTHKCETPEELGNSHVWDGQRSTWTPLVDYGAFLEQNCTSYESFDNGYTLESCIRICPSYLRPHFFAADIFSRLLCKIGYRFTGDITSKEKFRRQIDYLLKKDFGTSRDERTQLDVSLQQSSDDFNILNFTNRVLKIDLDTIVQDNTGNYQNGIYSGAGCVNVEINLLTRALGLDSGERHIYQLIKTCNDTGKVTVIETQEINGEDDSQIFEEINFSQKINLSSCQSLCLRVRYSISSTSDGNPSSSLTILKDSTINFIGERIFFEEGKEYKIRDIISCKNALSWFKGLTHLRNWKFDTNVGCPEIFAASPYSTEDGCEPFYNQSETLDWSDKIISKTKDYTAPDKDDRRYTKVRFKDSSDCYVESIVGDGDLYSRTFDRGEDINNGETKEIINQCYEPTANIQIWGDLTQQAVEIDGGTDTYIEYVDAPNKPCPLCLPKMCGSDGSLDEDELSWEIEPRTMLTFGSVEHGELDPADPTKKRTCVIWCDGETTSLIPTAYQMPDCPIGENLVVGGSISTPRECNLVFNQIQAGDGTGREIATLYTEHWAQWIAEQDSKGEWNFLADLDNYDYDCADFRKCIFFYNNGKPTVARLAEILAFNRCTDDLTNITLKPISQETICRTAGEAAEECRNFPIVNCTKDGECIIFSIGGTNQSAIQGVVFTNKTTGQTIPNTTILTAEICGVSEEYEVCATVSYLDCPDKTTPTKTVKPCGDNEPIIQCTGFFKAQTGGGYCVTAAIGGVLNDAYTIVSFTADGNPYTEGDEICGMDVNDIVIFEAVINFDDACEPITIQTDCQVPIPNGDCSTNSAQINCIEEEGCCKPELSIDCFVEQPHSILFWYYIGTQAPSQTEMGCLWDGKECLTLEEGEQIYWKAIVKFCGECDDYCIDWTSCEKEVIECPCEWEWKCLECELFAQAISGCEGVDFLVFKSSSDNGADDKPDFNESTDILLGTATSTDSVELDKENDCWYFIIARAEGCLDKIECWYFQPPKEGEGNQNVEL